MNQSRAFKSALCLLAMATAAAQADTYRVSTRASLPFQMTNFNFPAGQDLFPSAPAWSVNTGTEQVFAQMNTARNVWHLVQGSGCYFGTFDTGAQLVYLDGPTPNTIISFVTPDPANPGKYLPTTVSGFGTHLQSRDGGGSDSTAIIRAYSTTTNTWGSWIFARAHTQFSWTGGDNGDFIGVGSTARDISMVQISCVSGFSNMFGWWLMNNPSVSTAPSPAP